MANKRTQELQRREHNKRMYQYQCSKLKWFYIAALVVAAALLACYFFHWIYVYNVGTSSTTGDKIGTEVSVSGWSMFFATLFGQFESAASIYGDVAVPFYYYAQTYIIILGVITVVSVVVIIAIAALYAVALAKKKHSLVYVAMSLEIILLLLLIGAMAVALAANGSDILSQYCQNNPDCSVRTLTYVPIAVSAVLLAVGITATVKYSSAEKLLY
ncbi:MAG: hypothetical protein LUD19_03270 [Clostridia bacterium]|nr:hypothetical protein [Clostridia bacterium]